MPWSVAKTGQQVNIIYFLWLSRKHWQRPSFNSHWKQQRSGGSKPNPFKSTSVEPDSSFVPGWVHASERSKANERRRWGEHQEAQERNIRSASNFPWQLAVAPHGPLWQVAVPLVQLYNCVIKEVSTTKPELIFLGARTSETTTCASISSWKRNFKTRLKLLYFLACLQHRTQIAGHWFFDFREKAHAIEFYMWIEQNFPADPSVCNTQTSIVTRLLETTACSKTDSSWFFCVRTYAKVKDIGSPGPIQVRPWHLPHRQDYGLRGTSDHVLLA